MGIFSEIDAWGAEQVVFWSEPAVGYRGIIVVHDTTLGPGMGGTRYWNYETDEDALRDALLLARAMTYKAALAGLDSGGGKSVILGDNRRPDRDALFRAHGRAVASLGGRYIAAEDVGTSAEDMAIVLRETEFVAGLRDRSGDPSPLTALGVAEAIRAGASERYGDGSLDGLHVAVQGLGAVGSKLCSILAGEGARLTITDIDPARVQATVERLGVDAVAPGDVYDVEADVFAPCALGGVINDDTVPRLRAGIVAGAANNQLGKPRHEAALRERGILYVPDYVGNAGGLISIYGERHGWNRSRARRKVKEIFGTLCRIFALARREGTMPGAAANRLAENRLAAARNTPSPAGSRE